MNEELEVTVYTLDNNENYILLDRIEEYLYLANENDEKDIRVQKESDGFLIGLKDEDEVKKAFQLFYNKNKDLKLDI